MNVSHVMLSQERVKISPQATLYEANAHMDDVVTSALIVSENDQYVGVVSRWEIALKALDGHDVKSLIVGQAMVQPPHLSPHDPVERAVDLLIRRAGRALPVIGDSGACEGLVTWEQVDAFLAEILDLKDLGNRIHLALVNAPGQLARVLNVLARAEVNVRSLVISEPKVIELCHVVLKVNPEHRSIAIQTLRENRFTILE